MVILDPSDTAYSGSDIDSDALPVFVPDLKARIVGCHLGRRHGIMDEGIHFLDFFFVDPLGRIESLHLPPDTDGKVRRIEAGDG